MPGLAEGGHWQLEFELGRGYEKNVRPAPPDAPPPPPPGPPPPGSLPPPPAITSPGGDHFNRLQLAASWHYRSPSSKSDAIKVDWPTRVQAMLTRYDTFTTSDRDEYVVDTMPGWIYGNAETRLFANIRKTKMDGAGFSHEYSVRLLQTVMLQQPFGITFGADEWEQKFDNDLLSLKQEHRRHRLLAGMVGRYSPLSRFTLLATTGRDEGLLQRDDYDVSGLELSAAHTAMAGRLKLLLRAEYEHGGSVQSSGGSLERRKYDVRLRYRIARAWQAGFGYRLDDVSTGGNGLPASECYELTLGLEL